MLTVKRWVLLFKHSNGDNQQMDISIVEVELKERGKFYLLKVLSYKNLAIFIAFLMLNWIYSSFHAEYNWRLFNLASSWRSQ